MEQIAKLMSLLIAAVITTGFTSPVAAHNVGDNVEQSAQENFQTTQNFASNVVDDSVKAVQDFAEFVNPFNSQSEYADEWDGAVASNNDDGQNAR